VATITTLASCVNDTDSNQEVTTTVEVSTHPLASDIGRTCTVQFKRNVLGLADYPIAPTIDAINNVAVTVAGTLKAVRDNGILIESGTEKYWIPMDSILLIELGN
jgi:hypothetical protein